MKEFTFLIKPSVSQFLFKKKKFLKNPSFLFHVFYISKAQQQKTIKKRRRKSSTEIRSKRIYLVALNQQCISWRFVLNGNNIMSVAIGIVSTSKPIFFVFTQLNCVLVLDKENYT